jgi:hypothetical protein
MMDQLLASSVAVTIIQVLGLVEQDSSEFEGKCMESVGTREEVVAAAAVRCTAVKVCGLLTELETLSGAVSCKKPPDEELRKVKQKLVKTHTSDPAARSSYTSRLESFDILSIGSKMSFV